MRILLPVVAALSALLILPGYLFHFDVTPKVAVILIGTSAALLFFRGNANRLGVLSSIRTGRWFIVLCLVQVASLAISTTFSTNRAISLNGADWRRFGLLPQAGLMLFALLAAAGLAANRPSRLILLRSIAASGLVAALYGILQYFGWDPWLPKQAYHVGEGIWTIVRPPGTMGHASYLANFLVYATFAGAGCALHEERTMWKGLGTLAALVSALAILLSGTRGAIIGLAAGAIPLIVWLRPAFRARHAIAVLCALGAFTALYFSPAGLQLRGRTRWYMEDPRGGARLRLWRDSLAMAAAKPLTGFGPEVFASEFPRFESIELARAYPDFYHESPHNIFVDTLAAQGLPGLALLIGFVVIGFRAAREARSKEPILAATLAAMLAAALVSEQFTSFILPTALFFFLTVALLVSSGRPAAQPAPERGALWRLGFALVGFAISTLLALYVVRLVAADRELQLTKLAMDAKKFPEAIAHYDLVRKWEPGGAIEDIYYSRRMLVLSREQPNLMTSVRLWQQAVTTGLSAVHTAPDRCNAWYNLATLYAAINVAPEVEKGLRGAIDCSPNWFKPHWMLAQVLRASGKLDDAEQEAVAAVERDGGHDTEVTQTLEQIRMQRHK